MLAFFRRLVNSKVGLVITFVVLGLIALAFASGDVSSLRTEGMASLGGGHDVVRVGGTKVTEAEFRERVQREMEAIRQQRPTLDMPQFLAAGGVESTLERLTSGLALDAFGRDQGMLISRRAVDGQIASIPAFQGINGQFDPAQFRQLLADRKLTERGVREDLSRDMMGRLLTEQLLQPAGQAPRELALPYANLSLERRVGEIAFIPASAMPAGPAPTDAELQAFYGRNLARYTVPERRVIRYARISPDMVAARATPTEAEIAAEYKRDAAKYAPTEQRSITQVVVLDRAGADALAAKVKGGQKLTDAARAAGLETSTQAALSKVALAAKTSPALADAVFAAGQGATVGPVRGGLGYVVATVDSIRQVPGRTIDQARGEIAAALTKQKTADALNALHDAIDDKLAGSATFDEIVADQKLGAQTTPALLAGGVDPDKPSAPDPALAPLVQAAFGMQDGDEPQMVTTGQDGSFALVALGRVTPAAPRPLAQAREQVVKDLIADRQRRAARKVAADMLGVMAKAESLATAWSKSGLKTTGPKPLVASREDVGRAQGPTRAPLALLFAMPRGAAKLLEEPNGNGWAVIKLNTIIPGDASRDPARVAGLRGAFAQVLAREYAEQFVRAARTAVGVQVNAAAVARVKAELAGGAAR